MIGFPPVSLLIGLGVTTILPATGQKGRLGARGIG
jgi:hypothetical protein